MATKTSKKSDKSDDLDSSSCVAGSKPATVAQADQTDSVEVSALKADKSDGVVSSVRPGDVVNVPLPNEVKDGGPGKSQPHLGHGPDGGDASPIPNAAVGMGRVPDLAMGRVIESAAGREALDLASVVSGAQFSEPQKFCHQDGQVVRLTPVIVDFRRILQSRCLGQIVDEVPNKDLLHACAALFNTSLSEMTPDVLYACLCDKQARTIVLLKDSQDAVEQLVSASEPAKDESGGTVDDSEDSKEVEASQDVFVPEEARPSVFADVFSDQEHNSEDESQEEEEEEEEPDFSQGIVSFVRRVRRRRRTLQECKQNAVAEGVGVEHRLVAAATYEKTYCNTSEKIIHLTLLAVRKKYRKFGIGKYLLSQVKDASVVGQYEALVVHADGLAVDFFQRFGFSDDVVLNRRWNELAEQYTNCTLMSYLPPYSSGSLAGTSLPELDLLAMDKDLNKWRERSLEAYQSEMTCVQRMRREIINLRAVVSSQQQLIDSLLLDKDRIHKEMLTLEKEFLEYRCSSTKTAFVCGFSDDEDDAMSESLIHRLEREVARGKAPTVHNQTTDFYPAKTGLHFKSADDAEPYDHGKDTESFYNVTREFTDAMKADADVNTDYKVQMVTKAILTPRFEETFNAKLEHLGASGLTPRLYWCGAMETPHRLPEILKSGFSEIDFSFGDYGRGLYFSKYPSKAAHFSPRGALLVAEVILGATESVVKKDRTRKHSSQYFNSIITPGRLASVTSSEDQSLCQEYVVFDVSQAKPLYVINYGPAVSTNQAVQ